jgi:hypothetical protein
MEFEKVHQAACTSTHTTIKTVLFDGYAWPDMRTWRIAVFDVYRSSKEGDLAYMHWRRSGMDKSSSSPTANIPWRGRIPLERIYLR